MTIPFSYTDVPGALAGLNPSINSRGRPAKCKLVCRLSGTGRFVTGLAPGSAGSTGGPIQLMAGIIEGGTVTQGVHLRPDNQGSGHGHALCVLPNSGDIVIWVGPRTTGDPDPTPRPQQMEVFQVESDYSLTKLWEEETLFAERAQSVALLPLDDERFLLIRNYEDASTYLSVLDNLSIHICTWNGVSVSMSAEVLGYASATSVTDIFATRPSSSEAIIFCVNYDFPFRVQAFHFNTTSGVLGNVQTVLSFDDVYFLSAVQLDSLWSLVSYVGEPGQADLWAQVVRVTPSTITAGLPYRINQGSPEFVRAVDLCALNSTSVLAAYFDQNSEAIQVRELTISATTVVNAGDLTEVDDGGVVYIDRGTVAIEYLGGGMVLLPHGNFNVASALTRWYLAYIGGNLGAKLLGAAYSANGLYLYATLWSNGELGLQVMDATDLGVIVAEWSLGAATIAEVEDKTWWAYPLPVPGDDNQVIVYGRMNDPANLGLCHIIYSDDAGATFGIMENGWGDDHCGAMVAAGFFEVYAIRNIVAALGGATTQAKLYQASVPATPTLISTLPFSSGVNPRALEYDFNGNLIAAADDGQAQMVVYAQPPYTLWTDITGNHQTTDGVNSLEVIS